MTIQWKLEMLCPDPQCSYDQWIVMPSKTVAQKSDNTRTFCVKNISSSVVDKYTESDNQRYQMPNCLESPLKLSKPKLKIFESSLHNNIRIPEDPYAPHAFTQSNATPQSKPEENCITQVKLE